LDWPGREVRFFAFRSGRSETDRKGVVFGLTMSEGPVSGSFRRVSAVSPLSKPLDRGGLWTGPDGRSDYSEIDRGSQERRGFKNIALNITVRGFARVAGFPVCRRCKIRRTGAGGGRAVTHGPVFRQIRRVSRSPCALTAAL
jgi:hypothetical protein